VKGSEIRLANEAWETLFRAQATLSREFEHHGDWGDLLPTEYGVLYALTGAPDGRRMTELCDDVLLTQAGVSRLVARLEQRGLVERAADPDDGRASRIRLTPAGTDVQRRSGRMHARHVAAAMTRTLDATELETLRELSRRLLDAATVSRATDRSAAEGTTS